MAVRPRVALYTPKMTVGCDGMKVVHYTKYLLLLLAKALTRKFGKLVGA